MMTEVWFSEYRKYVNTRKDANNAMMALLAGSRLAAHTLQLTVGSQQLLPEIFPAVPQIGQFNLRTDLARKLLLEADAHLGAVAVPYALAVHEDFVISTLDLLKRMGFTLVTKHKRILASNMHDIFDRTIGSTLPSQTIQQFHLLRCMRNSQIHAGGIVSPELTAVISMMSSSDLADWETLTGRFPTDVTQTGIVTFTEGDIVAAFAVTKRLGRAINTAMQGALSRQAWAEIAVTDYNTQTTHLKNSDQWIIGLGSHARFHYSPLNLTQSDMETAAATLGLLTRDLTINPIRHKKK